MDVGVGEVVIEERTGVRVMNMGEGAEVGTGKVKGTAEPSELKELGPKQSVIAIANKMGLSM